MCQQSYSHSACPVCGHPCPPSPQGCQTPQPQSYCPDCCKPANLCDCDCGTLIKYPQELLADSTKSIPSANTFIGGENDVELTLEYVAAGTAPSVDVLIDSVAVLHLTSFTGYNVKDLPLTISVGADLTLKVTDAKARLRWCEDLVC